MKQFNEYLKSFIPPEDIQSARDDIRRFMETPTGRALQAGLSMGLTAELAEQRSFMSTLYAPQAQAEAQICEGRIQVLEMLADGILGFSGKAAK